MNNKISRVCSQPLSSIIFLVGPSLNLPLRIYLLIILPYLSLLLSQARGPSAAARQARGPSTAANKALKSMSTTSSPLSLSHSLSPFHLYIFLTSFVLLSLFISPTSIAKEREREENGNIFFCINIKSAENYANLNMERKGAAARYTEIFKQK